MTAKVTGIYRYPVKGFSPEELDRVDLAPGATIPFDRAYAVENGPIGFDADAPHYFPKIRFLMLMRNERIARLRTTFDPATTLWRIEADGTRAVEGRLDRADERARIESWLSSHFADELRGPPRILWGNGHSFSDVAKKVVHVVNLASVRDLERHLGGTIDPLRFRANIYVDGLAPWAEFDWIGTTVATPEVAFKAVKRTERCAATNVDPQTGARDRTIPADLMRLYGHTDCGIYLEVKQGGRLAIGDALDVGQLAMDL
jgi:uncharacterized protein YcbX